MIRLVRPAVLAVLGLGLVAGAAAAQTFPNRPIRIVVTFPPGGQTDVVARADMSLQEKMPYDTLKDLVPVSLLTTTPFVLAAPLSSKARNAADVVAFAKQKSENLSIGHGGNGSAMHLTALLFNHMAGIDIPLVPYRGSALAFADVVAGHIPLAVGDITAALALVRSGQMKPLGVSSLKRDPSLPDVQSFAEAGLAGYEAMGWFGIVAPAGTPKEVVAKLNEAVVAALTDPTVAGRMRAVGAEPHPTTPEEFGQFIRREIDKWGRVVRQAGLKAN
jgi:tripartite-type tricarboxylate transporter receptor subunit TctC